MDTIDKNFLPTNFFQTGIFIQHHMHVQIITFITVNATTPSLYQARGLYEFWRGGNALHLYLNSQ